MSKGNTKAGIDGNAPGPKNKICRRYPWCCDVIWQYITEDAIELAMSLGPVGQTQPVTPQAQNVCHNGNHNHNCIYNGGVGFRYTHVVNQFLEDLDDVDDNNEKVAIHDDLQELMMQSLWIFNINVRVKNGIITQQLY